MVEFSGETRGTVRVLLSTLAGLLILAGSADCYSADKVTIMVGGLEKQIYLPVKLAEQLGYLKETGLDVEILTESTGASAETEMLLDAAQGVVGFYDHTIDLQARGKRVEAVLQFNQSPGEVLMVSRAAANSIKSVADLKGKTVGVTGLGSSTYFITRFLASKAGLNNSEFTTLPVGSGPDFVAAMARGKIDAGMVSEPTVSQLTASGMASILVDLRTPQESEAALGGSYPGACLYMPTAWVNQHKTETRRIVAAFVKALQFIHDHSAEEIAEKMPSEYYAGNKAEYIASLARSKTMFTVDGVMPVGGPANVLAVLKDFDKAVQGKTINLQNTYTLEFMPQAK